ncbi:MAG: hypothetical protein RJA14_1894, partial [Pseudomonadota bacterium]
MALDAKPGERALAIAAPYAAAVLARLGLEATAQESDGAVFAVTGEVLAEEGVRTVIAPLGAPADGGYDVIISEGALPGRPEAWLEALNIGGRLAVVERTGAVGKAVLYVRGAQGVSRRELFNAAPPLLAELSAIPTFVL